MRVRKVTDKFYYWFMRIAVIGANALGVLIALGLIIKSWPILTSKPITQLLFSSEWFPNKGKFGFFPFIIGTIEVTALAMAIAIPICLFSSI